jgi:arylsulfatase A
MTIRTVAFSLLLCHAGLAMASEPASALPNIIILYADDLGYGDLGCSNAASKIPTPNLDKLAASGTRFTDGHSSSGICSPSRYAMLTGRHHWRDFHGIVGALGKSVFKKDQLTLPEMLKEKGYTTACIGKWHLGWDWDALRKPGTPKNSIQPGDFDWTKAVPDGPLAHGFDHYFGDTVINFPPYAWIVDDRLPRAPDTVLTGDFKEPTKEGTWEARPGPALSDWDFYKVLPTLTERSVEWVRGRKGKAEPFFLYVPFPSPHAPIIPNDEFDGKSQAGPYGDFVVQTDDACGRILAALEESGHADNTIVIFTADNGPEFYAYERDEKYDHWSAAPLRGLKRDIYEGGHHVPFLIRWPGLTKPGSVSSALVSQVDLMATLAAALDVPLPDGQAIDSVNFLEYLQGNAKAPRTHMVHNTFEGRYAFRDGDWLLVDAKTGDARAAPKSWNLKHGYPADDGGPVELYNMKDDIGQRTNLASEHPDRVNAMRALLAQVREGRYPELRAGAQEALPHEPALTAKASPDAPEVKVVRYKGDGKKARQIEVHFPKGHGPKSPPVPGIIMFHGGGWSGGDRSQFQDLCAYFASRGLVAATAEYTLVARADKKGSKKGGERGNRNGVSPKRVCITDAKSAIRWFKEHAGELGVDPAKIIAGGGSAGGHVSLLATTNPGLDAPDDPQGFDTSVVAYLLFNPALSAGDNEDAEVDFLKHVTKDFPPGIVFFGTEDPWLKGWRAAEKKLEASGVDRVEFWGAEGQGHGFFNGGEWKPRTLIAADRFLNKLGLIQGEPTLTDE